MLLLAVEFILRTELNIAFSLGRRIIWLGDLNYRINLPYNETRKLISTSDWTKLIEHDQVDTTHFSLVLYVLKIRNYYTNHLISFPHYSILLNQVCYVEHGHLIRLY